jgi:hypothetical protein
VLTVGRDHVPYCEHCGVTWPELAEQASSVVIDVSATPLSPDEDDPVPSVGIPRTQPIPEVRVRRFEMRRYGDGGGGCCLAGCLLVGLFFFLAFRGLLSLF